MLKIHPQVWCSVARVNCTSICRQPSFPSPLAAAGLTAATHLIVSTWCHPSVQSPTNVFCYRRWMHLFTASEPENTWRRLACYRIGGDIILKTREQENKITQRLSGEHLLRFEWVIYLREQTCWLPSGMSRLCVASWQERRLSSPSGDTWCRSTRKLKSTSSDTVIHFGGSGSGGPKPADMQQYCWKMQLNTSEKIKKLKIFKLKLLNLATDYRTVLHIITIYLFKYSCVTMMFCQNLNKGRFPPYYKAWFCIREWISYLAKTIKVNLMPRLIQRPIAHGGTQGFFEWMLAHAYGAAPFWLPRPCIVPHQP